MGGHRTTVLSLWVTILFGFGRSNPTGTEFITTFMENGLNSLGQQRYEVRISGNHENTTVTITVLGADFNRNITINGGRTISVKLPSLVEIRGSSDINNAVYITSNKPINVLSLNYKFGSAETSIVYPLATLGNEYYLLTPKEGSRESSKVFSIVAAKETTSVEISLNGRVEYKGQTYRANSVLMLNLAPFKGVQLISSDDLSGSRVTSTRSVAVLSGHTCAQKNTQCNHVFEQLLPVNHWGRNFYVAPFVSLVPSQPSKDIVNVVAAGSTRLNYVLDNTERNVNMVAGQVLEIEIESSPLAITASTGVQVTFYSTGGKANRYSYGPMLMNILDTGSYCSSYFIYGQRSISNYAILIAKNSSRDGITIDQKSLQNPMWHEIQGTDYMWLWYSIGNSFTSHRFDHPNATFGLQSVGIGKEFSYGSPGSCIKDPEPEEPSCSSTICPQRQVCVMENGEPKCVLPKVDVCWASGDPHYRTFDGKYYDFMGTCTYTMVRLCNDVGQTLQNFTVLAKNENRGNVRVSYVGQITFQTNDHIVEVKKGEVGYVRVNKARSLLPVTLNNGSLSIFQSGNKLIIEFGNDVHVSYDWNSVLRIELTRRYARNVCGMCGNYNQDSTDDFETPSGSKASNAVEFGRSWKVGNDSACWDDCHGPCLKCPPNVAEKFKTDGYCGLIGKTDNGPFSECHSAVDPKMYMENCVYDVCLNDGYKQISCQAVKAYADACQRAGANITQWRVAAGCSFECHQNSTYKLCGRACPATCQDPDASSPCLDHCVELCECDPGFVLIEGKCQPLENCGCFFEGRSYGPNETFWKDDKCSQKCVCNGRSQQVECRESSCRAGEECIVKDGLQDCYPTTFGMCSASGDPHYFTYDGLRYDFMGTCKYQFSALCDHSLDLTDFQVYVHNQNRGNIRVSYTTTVYINVYGMEIQISRQHPNKIMVNGLLVHLPYSILGGRLSLYRNPSSAVVSTDFGLTVTFDWSSIITVKLPSTYAGAVCGLCGNFNKNRNDDLVPKGATSSASARDFGRSWKVEDVEGCEDVDGPKCLDLAVQEQRQMDEATECGVLMGSLGPFRDCHALLDPEDYFKSCVYDSCILQQRQTIYCSVLSSYALACQAAGGTVHPWRSDELCALECPLHSHYELCASACPDSCNDLISPTGCDSGCREGCVCDSGFVLSGGECVPLSECGCAHNGAYYPVGKSIYVGDGCTERCTCSPGGNMVCSSTTCLPNEECRIENGVRGCYPDKLAVCTAFGDPHYKTFDGRAYDFQGLCSYVLAQNCENETTRSPRNLTDFKIITQHEKYGSSAAVVKLVTVEAYEQNLTLIYKRRGIVQVNGEDHRLPATLLQGKIRAEYYGEGTTITTDFGLKMQYDLEYRVTVSVPSTYMGRTCGLCGNYNEDASDDVGQMSSDIIAFGEKWKMPNSREHCGAGCGTTDNPCPLCQGPKSDVFSQNNYCGILNSTTGPFAKCHSVVDPVPFQKACISDLCQTNGEGSTLCNGVASYASACMEAGVTDLQWRREDFCALKCPVHGHYSPCVDLCSTSCAALTDPYECPRTCAEGCACDEGYLFDGTGCVPVQECGCFENGRYYKPNETIVNKDCSQECTCNPISGLRCRNASCAEDERCQILDGVRSCVNIDPCKSKVCRLKETCKLQDGKAVCVPDFNATCWAWGDPHYHTFDGYDYDFQGTCTYILAQSKGDDAGLVPFQVEAKNDNRGNEAVSFVRLVTISVYDTKVTMQTGEFGKIRVNDQLTNLPITLADGRVTVTQSGLTAVLETDFGLIVTYEWNWYVTATVPSSYSDSVSGLCGNFNQDPSDDQRAPNSTEVESINEWAGMWRVYDKDPFCWDYCPGNCPTCEESKKRQYAGEQSCGILFKEDDGPFRECIKKISPNTFFDGCLYDVCMNNGAQVILCQALETYASACMKQGIKIYDWRTPTECPKVCGENSHYEACGNACPATCTNRNATEQCTKPCVETCQCDRGFVLSVGKCVPISSCGCQYSGQYYQPNQEFWTDESCKVRCKCDPDLGMAVCQPSSCKSSETCMVNNGVLGCFPTNYTTCTASGDPHYKTFDGKKFDFMGTCVYQLVGVTSNDSSLTHFMVKVQNDNRGNKKVSFTKEVIFEVYNSTIIMSKDFPRKIKVNGIVTELPYYQDSTKITASIKGVHVFIKTDFDVTVTFDGYSYARVILPSTYTGAVDGLCGNNNQDAADDFTIGSRLATSEVEFGDYWKTGDVLECVTVTPPIPTCGAAQRQEYQKEQYCGLIAKSKGPFSLCHTVVDPTPYFEDCVFDACQYAGHRSPICSNIASYVSECQSKGIEIQEWRTQSFCPMICSSNSHYKLCGNGCPTTCYGFSSPSACVASCTEGCFCDNGYLLSGKDCVPITQCGCAYNDKYYKEGEEFFTDSQCQEKCTCGQNGIVKCQSHSCGFNEECKVTQGRLGCHAQNVGQCIAWGDPHYITLDGKTYDFQGTCSYTLVKANNSGVQFSVTVDNEPYGEGIVAVTKSVTVEYAGYIIRMERGATWTVMVDHEIYDLPYRSNDGQIWINQEGNNVVFQSLLGLKVIFDRVYFVAVDVPSSFAGLTEGLCGNFNGDMADDFRLPNGSQVDDAAQFGSFWAVAGDGSDCAGCKEGTCPECDPSRREEASSSLKCGVMADLQGPFKDCHALVNPDIHVTNCVYDMCAGGGGDEALCMSLQAYTVACQKAGAVVDGAWRSITSCSMVCPPNSHYEPCTRTCDFTCNGIVEASTCSERCFEGCECDDGFVFDGNRCVTLDQCGCIFNGRYVKVNESIVSEDCSQQCTCQAGEFSCVKLNCTENERCQLRGGQRGCYPRESECSIKSHYRFSTFDGISGNYSSEGPFVMASSCNGSADGRFMVVVDVEKCPGGLISKMLHVFTSNGLITVSGAYELWLNGQELEAPDVLWNGSVRIMESELNVTIEVVDHITVVLDEEGDVTLIAKEKIAGETCGACGNFNGDGSDDLRLKNGEPASSITYTIRSWKARFLSTCSLP